MSFPDDWSYRRKITISGSSGAGTGYQVLFKIGESSGSSDFDFHLDNKSAKFPSDKNDSGDLLFSLDDGTTLLPFWVEKVEGTTPNRTAFVWVKITDNLDTNTDIYCYYGNADADNVSNGNSVFDFFDDFDVLDKNKWMIGSGIWNIQDSAVGSSNDRVYIYSNAIPDADENYAIEYISKAATLNDVFFFCNESGGGQMFRLEARSSEPSGFAHTSSWTSWDSSSGLPTVVANTWYKISIKITGNTAEGTIEGVGSTSYTFARNGNYIGFQTDGAETSPGDWWDWLIIRKYIDPEPAFNSVGTVEEPYVLSGTVCDKNGNPIIGTTVKIFLLDKDTGELLKSTTSNSEDGSWSINTWSNKTLAVFALEGTYGEDTDIAGAEFLETE